MTTRYPVTIHINADMIGKIDEPIDPALVSRRPGGSNTTQAFLKGDIIADQLNSVFGPLGWSKASRIHTVDDWDETKTVQRNNSPTQVEMHIVQVISDVTLTIKKVTPDGSDTVFIEQGIGYGEVEVGKSRKEAYGMAVKGASTDGLKRCASLLGKAFGMMMASSGKQDDIEYAHNNKPQEIRKAKDMRASGGRAAHEPGNGARDDERRRPDGDAAQGQTRSREVPARDTARGGPGARGASEHMVGNDQHDTRRTPERGGAARAETSRTGVEQGGAPAAGDGHGAGPATEDKPKAARRTPITSYPLDNVPVTLDDQTDFGATLATRVKEMRQPSDRTSLVRQHINTIRNLDAPIRRRLMVRLNEEGVDVDRIAS